uniref:Uncharacterized protein n=1 Tax=Nelumbo nucifera TaxID=4432 RepID=A0A822XJY6_NELNU|nr:TPA_asm: hypothetical protein HUJ06_020852 [Nelumbo nucifera]
MINELEEMLEQWNLFLNWSRVYALLCVLLNFSTIYFQPSLLNVEVGLL